MLALSKTDRIFWLRAGLGALTGIAADQLFGTDFPSGLLLIMLVYIGSYYLIRRVWGAEFKADELTKMYTAGLGSFVLLFIFFYIFLFTLGLHSLNL